MMFLRRILSSAPLRVALMIGIILVVVLGPLDNAQAQVEIVVTVKVAELNMRASPSNRAQVVASLTYGTEVRLTGRDQPANWGFGTANGQAGWVALNFVEFPALPPLAALPVVNTVTSPSGATPNPTPPAASAGGESGGGAPPPPPVVSGSISGGFELGGQVDGLSPAAVDAMKRAGMTWVKFQNRLGEGAGAVGIGHANGFKVLLSVLGSVSQVTNEAYQNQYAEYVGSLAAAGADAIEIWNEMNIDREWPTGQINPASYVSLLAKSYNAIKRANPNTIVITGAPAPTGAEGAFGLERVWNDDRYVAGMARAGAGRYADCIGVHYNEGIVSPNQRGGDPRGDNYPTRYFDTMLARGLAGLGKKACFTELGYLSPEGLGPLPGSFGWAANVTVEQQAAWLAQAAVRASRSGRVRLMIIWNVNFSHYGADPHAGYAMIRPGGGCPACDALARVRR